MALSRAFAEAHIARWQAALAQQAYPYRTRWPSHLFHHAPLENARLILESGRILSRYGSENVRALDVAAPGVIDARDHAHDRVRFYFRPRTPTQFHIEGVRKPADCKYDRQAPVLVMFVIDALSVLTMDGTTFSDKNMQLGGAVAADDEASFAAIPFDKVFHVGAFQDASIKDHRCAEVMTRSPLPLEPHLKRICCRSEAERDTLLNSVDWRVRNHWRNRITVSDDLQVFDKKFVFVQDVKVSSEGVTARFNPRSDRADVEIAVHVANQEGRVFLDRTYPSMQPVPPNGMGWIFKADLPDDVYTVAIRLEGHLAYENVHLVGELIF